MSNPIGIDTTVWANEHFRQSSLNMIEVGEHHTPTPYIIKPLRWVWNGNQQAWEAPTIFGRLILWNTYTTNMWNVNLPGFTSSHKTRMEALQHAWNWYVNELRVKCLKLESPDEDAIDAHTGMTEDERRNIG